ncbi:MAG: class I SAM-dependent methyltransferase [Promethearchaeota archaeon]
MNQSEKLAQATINTQEWYDFIGQVGGVLSNLHLGGDQATQELLKMCQIKSTSEVLDVGCGTGETACEISKKYGAKAIGVDISEIMIRQAKKRAKKQKLEGKVEFRVADVFDLPFADNAFDVILLESVLTALPGDKKKALSELKRILRPGGYIGINETTFKASTSSELLNGLNQHPAMHDYFTPQTLKEFLSDAGLSIVNFHEKKYTGEKEQLKKISKWRVLSFFVFNFWQVLLKMLTDSRYRKAAKIDGEVNKIVEESGGYTLILAQKPEK